MIIELEESVELFFICVVPRGCWSAIRRELDEFLDVKRGWLLLLLLFVVGEGGSGSGSC